MERARKFVKNPLFSGSALMIGGSMGVNGINYLYHLLMGRIMGPSLYGNLASVFSVLYLLNIVPASTSFAIVKFISGAKNKKERTQIYYATKELVKKFSLFAAIIVLALAIPINNFLKLNDAVSVFLVSPILFVSLITLVNKAALQGVLKFGGVVGSEFVSGVGKLVIGIILVLLGYKVSGAVLAILIAVFGTYYLTEKLIKSEVGEKSGVNYNLKPLLKFALPVLLQALAFTSIFTIDLIIVKHFLPAFDAGLYAALSTLGKIIFFATAPVSAVMFPIVSGRKSKGKSYRNIFYISLIATVGISFSVIAFYYLFPEIAIGVLYGKAYLGASLDLVWMGIFMGFYTLSNLIVNFVLSLHKTKIVIIPLVIAVIQTIVLWLVHDTVRKVIQINTLLSGLLLVGLLIYLGYNELRRRYAGTK